MPRLKKLFFAFFYKINYFHILFHYIIVFFHFTNCHPIIVSGFNRKVIFIHYLRYIDKFYFVQSMVIHSVFVMAYGIFFLYSG